VVQETPTKGEQMKEIAAALSGVEPPASEFDFVTFDLSRTTVILRGFTIGEKRKEACAAAVKEISWVGHVLNYIEALSDSYNDEKLRQNIRFVLRQRAKRLYDSGSGQIRIKVNEGNVTLIGAIAEENVELLERAVAEMKVEELVRSVENKVTVRK
ncbi:MAG: hypothetical protein ACWGQW_22665, partial [bacterium]